jgi:SpoVK/Ycf46/Vps4 family AAA+-type ATPase
MQIPDIVTLLKARTTLLWVSTREEFRVKRAITEVGAKVGFSAVEWNCFAGTTDMVGKDYEGGKQNRDPEQALTLCRNSGKRQVWIFQDLDPWLNSPTTARALKSIAMDLQAAPSGAERTIVVLTPNSKIPEILQGCATALEWPLPDREEVGKILEATVDATLSALRKKEGAAADPKVAARIASLEAVRKNGAKEAAIDAAVGLTAEEVAGCYARSLVSTGTIDADKVRKDKASVISREKVLEWYEPDPLGLDGVGGFDGLKNWLRQRRTAFSPAARAYGLAAPKGMLLLGPPGTGKSLIAKSVASAWGMPLLRLDLGALKSKWVGESEGNIRKALKVAESVAPCVLWVDEIEKALDGATSGAADGGVSADTLGTILTFMQERQGAVFVLATANDVSKLPPELLRKGRFDELFFVDLPTFRERKEIAAVTLRRFKRDPDAFDCAAVASVTSDFTGAEIAAIVPEAMFEAFAQNREVSTDDIVAAASRVVPLAKTAAEKIKALREWASGRTRPATLPNREDDVIPSLGRTVME